MKAVLFVAALLAVTFTPFVSHARDGENPGKQDYSFGSPAKLDDATRTIKVTASDDMKFTPSEITIKQGTTVKFVVTNTGHMVHEFVIGDVPFQEAHERMMRDMPGMDHGNDPNALTLQPGQTKSIAWTFDKRPSAPIEIACHQPGHYASGMKIEVRLVK
ncbi:MAG TPA: cupredoxin family protein [Alphaproteobacteria bacterium]|nr:cupredoxin family protein [Alphaproteobacteria bacterium]